MFPPRPKGLGKENFLKLSDQEEVTGIFRGELITFKKHWVHGASTECLGSSCGICKEDPKNYPMFRFRINFIVFKKNQWEAKIFEAGGGVYDLLTSLNKKMDLSQVLIEITRRGMKQNTKYDFLPRTDIPISQEMKKQIQAMELLPLSSGVSQGVSKNVEEVIQHAS